MEASTTENTARYASIYEALSAAQQEIRNPEKTRTADTGKYKYKYADIGDVLECILPVLSAHGLSITQPTKIQDGMIILVTNLHYGQEIIFSEYPVCSLNGNHQAMGAAMTYARRYALTSLVGIAAVDDTDGEGAAPVGDGGRVKMPAEQAKVEINWPGIEKSIDDCKDFKCLDRREERVEQRKGHWPDTYYWKAKERIEFNRFELAEKRMAEAEDEDALADIYANVEGALDGKVNADELAALYRKHQARIFHGPTGAA